MSSDDNGGSFRAIEKNTVKSEILLLTTGSSTSLSKQNIYDLAGNVWEWTLECSNINNNWCAFRGGSYGWEYSNKASTRFAYGQSVSENYIGFRVALY